MTMLYSFSKNFGLTASELVALQERSSEDGAELSENYLSLVMSCDFEKLMKVWHIFQEKEGCRQIIPAYDPNFEKIGADDGFWVGIFDQNNNCVGVIASRLREVHGNLHQGFADKTFLMGPTPPENATCSISAQLDHISGPVAFIGALYVTRQWRASRIVKILVNSVIRMAYARWKPFWQVCLIAIKDLPLAFGTYGFQNTFGEVRFFDPRWQLSPRSAILGVSALEVRQRFLQISGARAVQSDPYQIDAVMSVVGKRQTAA